MNRRELIAALALTPLVRPSFAGSARYDVIVIGAGGAGLCAAVSAAESGASRVLIIEKSRYVGGHTILSEGTVNSVSAADAEGKQLWAEQSLSAGGGFNNKKLVEVMIEESDDMLSWLGDMGVQWSSEAFEAWSGQHARSYNTPSERPAVDYIRALSRRAKALGVEVVLGCRAEEIITDIGGRVCGVRCTKDGEGIGFAAPQVIIASGGFTGNVGLRMLYNPMLDASVRTTANPSGRTVESSNGDGIVMAQKLGADTVDMSYFELIPLQGGRILNYAGGDIYVNSSGLRFVDETRCADEVSRAYLELPDRVMWVITDAASKKNSRFESKLINGTVQSASTIKEMARRMGVPSSALEETIARYNRFVEAGRDEEFGKTVFTQKIEKPPFYFGRESFDLHTSLGGIRIDEKARVLRGDGSVIEGLYAAGETAGGVHGKGRLGGNALTAAFVFGRIAGREAAGALH